VATMFCRLAQAKSLREILVGLARCEDKLRHLGLEAAPKRFTPSYADGQRPWQLFEALFYSILEVTQASAPAKRLRFKNELFSLDATIVGLCLEPFDWAKYRQTKRAIKLHVLLDHEGYLPVFRGREFPLRLTKKPNNSTPSRLTLNLTHQFIDNRLKERFPTEA